MDVMAGANTVPDRVEGDAPETHPGAAALWSAIAADRRALDERMARLRAMRLIRGEDADA